MLKVLKGMKDVLPAESARWRALEREMRKAALTADTGKSARPYWSIQSFSRVLRAKAATWSARRCTPFWTRATAA